jgi:hypothetical protein
MGFFGKIGSVIGGVITSPIRAVKDGLSTVGDALKTAFHVVTPWNWGKIPDDIGNLGKDAIKTGLDLGESAMLLTGQAFTPWGAAGAFAMECVNQKL